MHNSRLLHSKIIITLIFVILFVVIAAFLYLSHSDWVNVVGWSGVYEKNDIILNGVEALYVDCSKPTQIQYSYMIESGQIELKIAQDPEGKELIDTIMIDHTCDDILSLNFDNYDSCYLFEAAKEGTVGQCEAWVQQRLSRLEQYKQEQTDKKKYEQMFNK